MHFARPDESFEFIVQYSSTAVHVNGSVNVVTHKLTELIKTCMDAILKARSIVMNEIEEITLFSVIKQLKVREYNKDTYFSLN